MPTDTAAHAVVLLLGADEEVQSLAELLGDTAEGRRDVPRLCIPPVRGLGFFVDASAQRSLDDWWSTDVPEDAEVVYCVPHAPGLAGWLPGLDGTFVVGGCPADAHDAYARQHTVLLSAGAPEDYARALSDLGVLQSVGDELTWLDGPPAAPANSVAAPDPFDLLSRMQSAAPEPVPVAERLAPANGVERRSGPAFRLPSWVRRDSGKRQVVRMTDAELASRLTERGATIVAVGSRKGGVGKTSHAAGMAIVAGTLLDSSGHRAAIVDANVANPDAWGQLNLPGGAATVRDVVTALNTNAEPPSPIYTTTPALACYPESREGCDYSRTDIIRFAQHLRGIYAFIVVDMSNRLPDPIAGPEAAVAAFWLEQADCLVLPTASSKQDFNGVLDYLEIRDLPPTVVAYIAPGSRRNREHPLTKRYLAAISQRAQCIVSLPDDPDRVRYAGMEGIPVHEVSPALGKAYRDLVQGVALTPKHRGT